ncbi:MAG: hypothetical protein KGL39_58360 [Patescibacteria group bacterium]|nr:hypothetical protein [Patescibacteria group bacterium]
MRREESRTAKGNRFVVTGHGLHHMAPEQRAAFERMIDLAYESADEMRITACLNIGVPAEMLGVSVPTSGQAKIVAMRPRKPAPTTSGSSEQGGTP